MDTNKLNEAANRIKNSNYAVAFTGAGISVESGVPPFRGENGIWENYDPMVLDLNYFYANPEKSWTVIRELFYQFFGNAKANSAHTVLAQMEKAGIIKSVITQNIDNLHQQAGSKVVFEFHGNSQRLLCVTCDQNFSADEISMKVLPPRCSCGGLIKPDFIFFGEGIPQDAYSNSMEAIQEIGCCSGYRIHWRGNACCTIALFSQSEWSNHH